MIMITFLSTENHIYEQNNSNMKQFLHKTYSTAKLETFGWKQEKNMTEFCFCSLHVDTTLRIINLFNIFNFFNIPDSQITHYCATNSEFSNLSPNWLNSW